MAESQRIQPPPVEVMEARKADIKAACPAKNIAHVLRELQEAIEDVDAKIYALMPGVEITPLNGAMKKLKALMWQLKSVCAVE